jgi:hypothetical protein
MLNTESKTKFGSLLEKPRKKTHSHNLGILCSKRKSSANTMIGGGEIIW